MVFISLKFCVILSVIVIAVKAINGASNASATMQHPDGGSNVTIFTEAGISKPMAKSQPTKQISGSNNSSWSNKTSAEDVKHNRGIYPTDPENSSNSTKNTSTSSDKASSEITADKNQSQIAPKVELNVGAANSTVDKTVKATSSTPTTKPTSTTSTSTSTSTSTTTSTTTTPKTTTTAFPKKPNVTYSVEDVPGTLERVQAKKQTQPERVELPVAMQSSETISYQEQKSSHNYLMSIIGMIVVVPFVVLVTNCAVRHVRDYWSKRRYRRMDYLIEDMYN